MKRKVGILCACDAELKPFLERLRPQRSEVHAMRTFHIGRLGDVEAVLVCCGICKVNAALAAQLLIDRLGVDAVVCAGTAGGMAPEVGLFDTVIAERMVYHDIADGLLSACHPRMERDGFRADPELLAAARVYAATAEWPVRFGTTATGERFITERRREEINRLYAPLAVDMETAAAAHVCHANGTPFLSIRTITDTAECCGTDHFERNRAAASQRTAEVALGTLARWSDAEDKG